MTYLVLQAAVLMTAQTAAQLPDGPTLFSLFERYHAAIKDISFIHEGTFEWLEPNPRGETGTSQFPTFYAYRADGATLLDVFSRRPGELLGRTVSSILGKKLEMLDATPDRSPPIRDRTPDSGPGGPGSLARIESPERLFLLWYFKVLGDPAVHPVQVEGWEDVGGRRCVKLRFLQFPESSLQSWEGGLPYVRFWCDLERDGYPIRHELLRGHNLKMRMEVTNMEQVQLPDGRFLWIPTRGTTLGFEKRQGDQQYNDSPTSRETHSILFGSIKINQGLPASFFSVKKHALIASEEELRKLQRKMDSEQAEMAKKEKLAMRTSSQRERLDAALREAESQSKMLEASSLAREGPGWDNSIAWILGFLGVAALVLAGLLFWRSR